MIDNSEQTSPAGIEQSSRWNCDIYRGSKEALIAAGIIAAVQLERQPGRREGYTVFLPDGQPCPPTRRAWRDPGYKTILLLEDGSYLVEATASKEVQARRREQENAVNRAAEQERINEEIAQHGHKYRNWQLHHNFDGCAETWEGTKAQLQAEGIGTGLAFPGEPGSLNELYCRCPLGFDVRIYQSGYERAKTAAGIYTAQSRYIPLDKTLKQFAAYSHGVVREVWTPVSWVRSDFYCGSAEALVNAGLVLNASYFPGQPGRSKGQASYSKDWSSSTTANGRIWIATIRKLHKSGQYSVEIPVSREEQARREAVRKARDDDTKKKEQILADERRQLRLLASGPGKGIAEFRENRGRNLEVGIKMLWREVFGGKDGLLGFNIPAGSKLYEELGDAFQTLRDAVQSADVTQDERLRAELQKRLGLTGVRDENGLRSLLHARHLRLVYSSPNK